MLNVYEQCLDLQADIKSRGEDTDVDYNVIVVKVSDKYYCAFAVIKLYQQQQQQQQVIYVLSSLWDFPLRLCNQLSYLN